MTKDNNKKDNLLTRSTLLFYGVAVGSALLVVVGVVFLSNASGAEATYAGAETPNATRVVGLQLHEDLSGSITVRYGNGTEVEIPILHSFTGVYLNLVNTNGTNTTNSNTSNLTSTAVAAPVQEEEGEEAAEQEPQSTTTTRSISNDDEEEDSSATSEVTTTEEEEEEPEVEDQESQQSQTTDTDGGTDTPSNESPSDSDTDGSGNELEHEVIRPQSDADPTLGGEAD